MLFFCFLFFLLFASRLQSSSSPCFSSHTCQFILGQFKISRHRPVGTLPSFFISASVWPHIHLWLVLNTPGTHSAVYSVCCSECVMEWGCHACLKWGERWGVAGGWFIVKAWRTSWSVECGGLNLIIGQSSSFASYLFSSHQRNMSWNLRPPKAGLMNVSYLYRLRFLLSNYSRFYHFVVEMGPNIQHPLGKD